MVHIFLLHGISGKLQLYSRHCELYLVWCSLFYISIGTLVLYSGISLVVLHVDAWSLKFLNISLAGPGQHLIRANCTSFLKQTPSVHSNYGHELWSLTLWLFGMCTVPNIIWALGTVPSNSFGWWFPLVKVVSSNACTDQYFAGYLRTPSVDLQNSRLSSSFHYSVLWTLASWILLHP